MTDVAQLIDKLQQMHDGVKERILIAELRADKCVAELEAYRHDESVLNAALLRLLKLPLLEAKARWYDARRWPCMCHVMDHRRQCNNCNEIDAADAALAELEKMTTS